MTGVQTCALPIYQILIEADYLVNADESQYSEENIRDMLARVFRTETGRELLEGIYLNQERNYHGQK